MKPEISTKVSKSTSTRFHPQHLGIAEDIGRFVLLPVMLSLILGAGLTLIAAWAEREYSFYMRKEMNGLLALLVIPGMLAFFTLKGAGKSQGAKILVLIFACVIPLLLVSSAVISTQQTERLLEAKQGLVLPLDFIAVPYDYYTEGADPELALEPDQGLLPCFGVSPFYGIAEENCGSLHATWEWHPDKHPTVDELTSIVQSGGFTNISTTGCSELAEGVCEITAERDGIIADFEFTELPDSETKEWVGGLGLYTP